MYGLFLAQSQPDIFQHPFIVPVVTIIKELNNDDDVKNFIAKLKLFEPQFLHSRIDQLGSTILHTQVSPTVLRLLLKNADAEVLASKNAEGRTALHEAVIRGDIDAVLTFIAFGSDVNALDCEDCSPLFYAIEKRSMHAVKALLLFKADTGNLKNLQKCSNEMKTAISSGSQVYYSREPRNYKWQENDINHIALRKTVENSLANLKANEFFNSIAFDGGGMRGLVSLQILREISNRYNGDFLKSFKSLGGTSTGSILILALAKYGDLDQVTKLYLRLKDDIFCGSRPYDGQKLEDLLTSELGNVSLNQLGNEKQMRLAITVTTVNVSPPKLAIFRSFSLPKNIVDDRFTSLENFTAAQIARCSSAAPTYFNSVNGKYMDGGIIANNPSCEILCDQQTISLLLPESKQQMKIMLSVGTGQTPQKTTANVDVAFPQTTISGFVSSLNTLAHMKDVFIDQLTSADGVNVDRSKLMSCAMGVSFFRFSPKLSQNYELDDVRADRLIDMMWETKIYMHSRLNDINILLSLLE